MRRALLVALACLALAPAAQARCKVTMSAPKGEAPLHVRFQAACRSTSYRWAFGDGRRAHGASVRHTFAPGRFTPKLVTDNGSQRVGPIESIRLTLVAPRKARYGQHITLRARVVPALPVTLAGRRLRRGRIDVAVTRPWWTVVAAGVAARATIRVTPRLDIRLAGSPTIGSPLSVVATLRPARAGHVRVRVDGKLTRRIDTSSPRRAHVVVTAVPRNGWRGVYHVVAPAIAAPSLGPGAHGPAVVALEQRLGRLHYALRGTDGVYGDDDAAAVLAFQKVNGLERTGLVSPALWQRLAHAGVPRARAPGDHVEVDKTRQVLFLVRGGKVALVVHVSTGATGNTPVGVWHVYSKVAGWSWVLWYPSYFLRGFAIHGYPDVPPYPASHGCVRVPMWIATRLYAQIPYGGAVVVY